MEIDVINQQNKVRVSKKWTKRIAAAVLKKIGVNGELSIVLVDNDSIRALNRKYRHKDRATDVLSFQQISSCVMRHASCVKKRTTHYASTCHKRGGARPRPDEYRGGQRTPVLLGDVVISAERAKSQAKECGYSFKDEMAILITHGILHLLGLTHKEMAKIKKLSSYASLSSSPVN